MRLSTDVSESREGLITQNGHRAVIMYYLQSLSPKLRGAVKVPKGSNVIANRLKVEGWAKSDNGQEREY